MEKYNIRLAYGEYATVKGRLLKKHKYAPEITLFVHRGYLGRGNLSWTVSEFRTGLSFTYGKTRREAIARVETLDVDTKSLLARIDRVVSQRGEANILSPTTRTRDTINQSKNKEQ